MILPEIFQHKCGQLTVTQGSEIPAGSDCMPSYLLGAPHLYLGMVDQGHRTDSCAGHKQHKHSKSAATRGCATKDWAKHANMSAAVMPRLQGSPEYIFEDFSIL